MKKTILVGLIAATMLFAFTACESGSSSYGAIAMVTASTSVEYVVGVDTPDAADFTFTGYTVTGDAVSIPSNQFEWDGEFPVATDTEDKYSVTFNWSATTAMKATGTVTMYAPEVDDIEVSAGTAKVQYYTVASGANANASDTTDYAAINANGAVITVPYDGTKTREIVLDSKNSVGLVFKFGKVGADGTFTADDTNEGKVPTNPGSYAIGIFVAGSEESPIGTYDVTVSLNRVESTELYVADDYVLYTNGTSLIYDGEEVDGLEASKVYVTKAMTNGQVVIAEDDSEVLWGTNRQTVSEGTTANSVADVEIDVNEGETTRVYAKYVGGNVSTDYNRGIYTESFAPITSEISGVVINAYDVELVVPETAYSGSNPVEEDEIGGVTFEVLYNSGIESEDTVTFSNETISDELTWRVATPTLGSKEAGDSVSVTIIVSNGDEEVARQSATATLVTALSE